MTEWLLKGPPVACWVPCFFFPQGFMTASKQVYARSTGIAIDTIVFSTDFSMIRSHNDVETGPEKGVYIYGMYIQGCGFDFDKCILVESSPRELFILCPIIHLHPMLKHELNVSKDYQCPLYKTSERKGTLSTTGHSTNFVLYFNTPTDMEDTQHWIRRGVCLLCMLDD